MLARELQFRAIIILEESAFVDYITNEADFEHINLDKDKYIYMEDMD